MATITGHVGPPVDSPVPGGTPVDATLDVALCGYGSQIPRSPDFALMGRLTEQNIPVDADGEFTFTVVPNDEIQPAGTYYTVTLKDANGDIAQVNAYMFLGDNDYDLDDVDPFDPSQPMPPLPPLIINQLLIVPWSPTPNFPGDQYLTWAINLTGDVTSSTVSGLVAGNLYTMMILQDSIGGHQFTWAPQFLNATPVNPKPNGITIQTFVAWATGGPLLPIGPATYS